MKGDGRVFCTERKGNNFYEDEEEEEERDNTWGMKRGVGIVLKKSKISVKQLKTHAWWEDKIALEGGGAATTGRTRSYPREDLPCRVGA